MQKGLSYYFKVSEYGSGGDKVIFIFGGWKFKGFVYRSIIRDLVKRRFTCVLYVPRSDLIGLGTPYSEIVRASGLAVKDVQQRIAEAEYGGVKSFSSIGTSLGTIFAMESAKACLKIGKLLLFAPFGDFADHVERWPKHRYFSRVLASQPTSQTESGEILNQVGSYKDLLKLKDRHIFVCYATHDISTHTQVAERFLRKLQDNQFDVEILKVSGGHLQGILKGLFISRAYRVFLEETE